MASLRWHPDWVRRPFARSLIGILALDIIGFPGLISSSRLPYLTAIWRTLLCHISLRPLIPLATLVLPPSRHHCRDSQPHFSFHYAICVGHLIPA
jgi:hypothetical protein